MPKKANTVRKNVCLDCATQSAIDAISKLTGKSKSEIIDMAFRKQSMKMMAAYAQTSAYENCFVNFIDAYQSRENLDERTSRKILTIFIAEILPYLVFRKPEYDVSQYIRMHMPMWCVERSNVMKTWYERAKQHSIGNSLGWDLRKQLGIYAKEMLEQGGSFLTESYLFRNLSAVCDACCEKLDDERSKKVFDELVDAGVFQ